jgi:2-oxo-4-hydroxy-4-carboxy-5-ureidoimidazoline decarboxylase
MTGATIAGHLNGIEEARAKAELRRCCASARWADAMLAARPFADDDAVFGAAERAWWALGRADWLEAFAAHPRIGDRDAPDPRHAATQNWSRAEQAGATEAGAGVRAALAAGNAAYEARFGHVFLICATGRSGEEMLAGLRRRLSNDPDTELRVAAGEQAKITRLRLERLADP